MVYVYHGSKISGLSKINPFKSGYNKKYVYAVSDPAFAVIFINRQGGSLVASWGRLKDGKPYFCEKIKGVFNSNYKNQNGSLYILDKSYFLRKKGFWNEEFISSKEVPVIKEVKINDLEEYLLELEKKGKFKFIPYEKRLDYFPEIDGNIMKDIKKLEEKYSKEKVLYFVKKYRPDIIEKLSDI
ncbi:MAG: hypothetical protein ACOC1P_04615 [Minisyncoccales bacterium]